MARMKVAKNIAYDDDRQRYYVTFHYGNGVKSTKTFTTKADAVRALKQFEADKANEEVVEPTRDSLGEWMRYWLENISKPNVRATTYHGYKNLVERHLIPSLGGKPLQKVTAADIREYYKKKLSGPKALSQNSLRKHHDVLNQIFQAAVLEDKLRKNPMRIVSAPKKETIQYDPKRPRYVRITDINDDGTLNDDVVSSANIEDDEQYRLTYGDFMFARMGATVGKTYAYKTGNQIFAGYLIRYRLNLSKITPEYLFAYTQLDEYKNWVVLNQSGAAQPGINAKKYGSLKIPVAPMDMQRAFQDFVSQVDKSKLSIQASLDQLETLKQSLMQRYFG